MMQRLRVKAFWSGIGWLGIGLAVGCGAWAEPLTSVAVEVSGGQNAGSYARASPDTLCTFGSGDAESWQATLASDRAEPGELSIFMFDTPKLSTATTDFSLILGFGAYGADDYTEHVLEPVSGKGVGDVSLTQTDRKHAQLVVTGQTAEGIALNATLTCNDVLDLSGRSLSAPELGELTFASDAASPTGSLTVVIGDKSYTVQTGSEGSCTRGMAEAGDLWYEYYTGEGHTDLLLMTNDVETAKAGTSSFGFSIDMSPIHEPGDAGTLTVTEDGNQLTLLVDAQTSDGTPVQVTAVCPLP